MTAERARNPHDESCERITEDVLCWNFSTMTSVLRFLLILTLLPATLQAAPDFIHEVAPLLQKRCCECHTAIKKKGGLSMDDEQSFREGSENGPIVDITHLKESGILQVITSKDDDVRMPPKGKSLDQDQVELLRAWVAAGAPWEPGFAFKKKAYERP